MKAVVNSIDLEAVMKRMARIPSAIDAWLLAKDTGLVVTVDNRQSRWSLQVPAVVEENGNAYVPFDRIRAYINGIADAPVRIECSDSRMALLTDNIKAHLPLNNGSTFTPPRVISDAVKVSNWDAPSFANAVKAGFSVVGNDDGFGYTSGMLVSTNTATGTVMATDRLQVIAKRFQAKGDPVEFTVEAEQLMMCASFHEDYLRASVQDNNVRISSRSFLCDLSPFHESLPDKRAFFMDLYKDCKITAKLDTVGFLQALGLCASVGAKRNNVFSYLDLSPDICRLRSDGDREDETDIKLAGQCSDKIRIWIRPDQIYRTLSHLHRAEAIGGEVTIAACTDRTPLFFPLSDDGVDFLCISVYTPQKPS